MPAAAMIASDDERSWRSWILPGAILLSIGVHLAVFSGLAIVGSRPKEPTRVEVEFVRPPPPPPPPPLPKPIEKAKVVPPKAVRIPPPPPASNQSKPVESKEPPKPVFGITAESAVADGGIEVPIGNTLMKEPDKEFTPPEQVKPYYQPVKAPFVPAKLVEVTEFPTEKDRVVPDYPAELRAQGVEGTVVLEVDIDAGGNVVEVRIKRPTGLAFDEAAVKAVKASKYNPARRGKESVAIRVTIPVKFRLR